MCKSRLLSILLIFFMFFSNPAFITYVYADTDNTVTAQDMAEFSVDKSKTPPPPEDDSKQHDNLSNKERAFQFGNNLLDSYLQNKKGAGPEWLKNTDIQIYFAQNYKPIYSIETLLPWGKVRENGTTMFWQGRYSHGSSNSSTANLGLGWRRISQDKSSIIGLNLFYDYDFAYNLSRIGLGAENFNKLAEYRLNWYQPVSESRKTDVSYLDNGILYGYIRAADGLDFEAGTSFKNIPWLKLYASGYYWNNKYHANESGIRLRASLQLTPRLNMEIGYLNSNLNSSYYGQIKYQLVAGAASSWLKDNQAKGCHKSDLSSKLYQKVERENDIKTETYTKFIAYKGNIQTTVTNSINHKPIAGAIVQAYQNGTAASTTVATDASGNAMISSLNTGAYIMHVTYGAYNVVSSPVSVTKDQTAMTAITIAASEGLGNVNVKLAGTMSANDYKVTITDSAKDTYNIALNSSSQTATIAGIKEGSCTASVITPNGYTASIAPSSFDLKAGDTQTINIVSTQLPQQTGTVNINLSGTMSASDYTVKVTDSAKVDHSAKVNSTTKTATLTGIPLGSCTVTVTAPSGCQVNVNPSSFTLTTSGQVINIVSTQLPQQTGTVNINLSGTMSASDYTVKVTDSAKVDHSAKVNSTTKTANLTGIPLGSCTVNVTAPSGYQVNVNPGSFTLTTSGQAINIVSTQTGTVNINLSGTMSASDYTVKVTDSANVDHSAKVNSTTKTANLTGIPLGSCTVNVTAPSGYQVNVNPSSFTLTASGQAISILSTQQTGDLSIKLSGTMSASDYTITVTDSANVSHSATVNSTASTASILMLPVGSYTVSVTAPDGYQATASPSSFTLTTSGQAVSVNSIIPKTTITAKNYGGLELPGLSLQITNTGTNKSTTATTSAWGKAIFSGLAAGRYTATLTDSNSHDVGSKSNFTVNNGSDTSVTVEFDIAAIAYELANTTASKQDFVFTLTVDGIKVYPGNVITVGSHQSTNTIFSGYYLKADVDYEAQYTDPYFGLPLMWNDKIPSGSKFFGLFMVNNGSKLVVSTSW